MQDLIMHHHFHHIRAYKRTNTCINRNMGIVCQIMIIFLTQKRGYLFFFSDSLSIIGFLFFPRRLYRSQLCLMNQCFCRNASNIDAGTSIHLIGTLNNSHLLISFGQLSSQCFTAFAKAYYYCIILLHNLTCF